MFGTNRVILNNKNNIKCFAKSNCYKLRKHQLNEFNPIRLERGGGVL